jgi:hypothetical protein
MKSRHSRTLKSWFVGCAVACLAFLLLFAGLAYWSYQTILEKVNGVAEEFVSQGYEKIFEPHLDIREGTDRPMIYIGRSVYLGGNHSEPVAILAQVAEIQGLIKDQLSFRGKVLILHEGSVVEALDVQADEIINHGEVKQPITGSYKIMNEKEGEWAGEGPDN